MEFNFPGDDDLKAPPFQFPSSFCYPSLPSFLPGGFPSLFHVPKTEQMLTPTGAGEEILRELEKQQVRREIISVEIARRRILAEEVRKELMLERELAFRRNLGEKFLCYEQAAMGLNPRFNVIPPYDNQPLEEPIAFPNGSLTMPQSSQPVDPEIEPAPKSTKDKLIELGKPDPDLYKAKRKAETEPAVDDGEHSPPGSKKRPKDDWSCALCQVSVTSEKALNEHLQGRKHKAKESTERMQEIGMGANPSFSPKKSEESLKPTETIVTTSGLDAKADVHVQPEVTGVGINQMVGRKDLVEIKTEDKEIAQKTQNTEDSKKQNVTERGQVTKPSAVNKGRFKVWCELCQIGSYSEDVMERHRKGKKHTHRLKKSCQNDGSAPPTSAVVSEATPLAKDAHAANNIQKYLKETDDDGVVMEGFSNSKSSPAAKFSGYSETIVATAISGLDAKANVQVQSEVTGVGINQTVVRKDLVKIKTEDKEIVQKTQNTEDSEKQNGTETDQVTRPNAGNKQRFKVWCELCQVGSFSEVVMKTHWKGKRHINQLKKSRQNDGNASPTAAVVSEATSSDIFVR